jgi:hypothetical protein
MWVLTRVSNFAITQLVEDDEVHARQVIGHSALPTCSGWGFELVDQIDDVEDEVTGAAPIPTGLSPAARAAVDELREQARESAGRSTLGRWAASVNSWHGPFEIIVAR